mmetsp:Transcript_56013/g.93120  ORF Transcript_56013/g.93120 Transcript_56013/m.93120 type:complete len:373 (-) Transcript_56013:1913-3031(-)
MGCVASVRGEHDLAALSRTSSLPPDLSINVFSSGYPDATTHDFAVLAPCDFIEESDERYILDHLLIKRLEPGTPDHPELSYEEVVEMVGHPAVVPVTSISWSCIDGRSEEPVLATPGGDAGEFLLALAVASKKMDNISSYFGVANMLYQYVRFSVSIPNRRFYMHTDEIALEKMRSVVGENFDIQNPPIYLRSQLLDLLRNPDYVGCGHIKLQLLHPEEYGIDRSFVEWFLTAFYSQLWMGDASLVLKVLKGKHTESCVLLVNQSGCQGHAPLLRPTNDHRHMFVFDEQSIRRKRHNLAKFFSHLCTPHLDGSLLLNDLQELGSKQLAATTEYLAKGLAIYSVSLEIKAVDVAPLPGDVMGAESAPSSTSGH